MSGSVEAGQSAPKTSDQAGRADFPRWPLLLIVGVGFGLRAINLLALPIFSDEAIHISKALLARSGQLNEYSLFSLAIDGKTLHGWLLATLYNWVGSNNLLIWARLLSALFGVVTLLTCYKLTERLFSVQAGLLAAGLWAITPFTLWHDRMALVDSLMATMVGLVIYFSVRLLDLQRVGPILAYSLLAGLALSGAILTKLPGVMIGAAPVLAVFLLPPSRLRLGLLPRLIPLYGVAGLTTLGVMSLFKGEWGGIQKREKVTQVGPDLLWHNLTLLAEWSYNYLTVPLLLIVVLGVGWAVYTNRQVGGYLLLIALSLTVVFVVLAGTWFPRYIVAFWIPILTLAAGGISYGLARLKSRSSLLLGLALLGLLTLPALWFDYLALSDPAQAPIPTFDRFQYVEGWPAGYGLTEVGQFLEGEQKQASRPLTVLGTDLIPYNGLSIYFSGRPNFEVIYASPNLAGMDETLKQALQTGPTFFVLTDPKDSPNLEAYRQNFPSLTFRLVFTAPRPGDQYHLLVYKIEG